MQWVYASSLAAAAPGTRQAGDLFEHPGWVIEIVTVVPHSSRKQASNKFFKNLLV
jgi:hypothetical protein